MPPPPAIRTAIVTGAASGLGRAMALRLAREQWTIALADIDVPGANETLRQVRTAGGDGLVTPLDVTQLDAWTALVEQLRRDWPQLDLLVNNAGVCAAGEIGSLPVDQWRRVFEVNLWGVLHGCHSCTAWLKANRQSPHIINVASIIGLLGGPTLGAYAAAKAGVVALSESLRVELARHGVGVSVVCPGFFRTNLIESGAFDDPAQRQYAESLTRRARISADDVAVAALDAMRKRQFYVVLPRRADRLWWFKRWFPEWYLRQAERQFQAGVPQAE